MEGLISRREHLSAVHKWPAEASPLTSEQNETFELMSKQSFNCNQATTIDGDDQCSEVIIEKPYERISPLQIQTNSKIHHHHHHRTKTLTLSAIFSLILLIDLTPSKSIESKFTEANNEQDNFNVPHRTRHKRWLNPNFTEPIGNHTVPIGRDVQLWCKTNNLDNKYRTAWLRVEDKQILSIHDSLITRNYRIGVIVNEASSVLTIKNVQESDKGGYMCQINSVPMRYAVGYLDILIPPTFERQQGEPNVAPVSTSSTLSELNDATNQDSSANNLSSLSIVVAQEGSNATLSCKARAYPEPTIQWRREDNEPIDSISKSVIESSDREQLQFNQVSRLHAGAYLCIASNGVPPAASKRLILDVQFAPVIRVPEREVPVSFVMPIAQSEAQLSALATAQWGRPVAPSAHLRCFVELNPAGSYHWLRVQPQQERDLAPPPAPQLDLVAIEAEQITNSDKYEIVILDDTNNKLASSQQQQQQQGGRKAVEMRLSIRVPNKQDLGEYRCLGRNSLGTQWGDVKLVEMSQSQLLASQQHATSSSPFAFKELFRFASSNSDSASAPDTPPPKSVRSRSGSGSSSSSLHIRSNQSTRSSQQQQQQQNGSSNCQRQTETCILWIMVAISSVAQLFLCNH